MSENGRYLGPTTISRYIGPMSGLVHPSDQDPHPKMEKNKCVLNWLLGKIQCFKTMFCFVFLSGKSPVADPPLFFEPFPYFWFRHSWKFVRGVYSSPDSYILPCLVCRWNYVCFVIFWGGVNNYGTFLLQICFIMFQKFPKIPHKKSHVLPNLSYFPYILPGFIKSCPWFGRCLSAK